MNNSLINDLMNLGLTLHESKVYLTLLRLGKGTALDIAEHSDLKRPTIYSIITSLEEKGLVETSQFREVKDFTACGLDGLSKYIHRQHQLVGYQLEQMIQLYNVRPQKTRLRIYHNTAAIKTLLEKSIREKAKMHIIGDRSLFEEKLGSYWDYYSDRVQIDIGQPDFKFCEGEIAVMLWSDKVAFVDFDEPIQLLAFKNKSLHKAYQEIWKNY